MRYLRYVKIVIVALLHSCILILASDSRLKFDLFFTINFHDGSFVRAFLIYCSDYKILQISLCLDPDL